MRESKSIQLFNPMSCTSLYLSTKFPMTLILQVPIKFEVMFTLICAPDTIMLKVSPRD